MRFRPEVLFLRPPRAAAVTFVVVRLAWERVSLAAFEAARPVVVAARLAVLFASPLPLRADVTVPLAPDFAALAVLAAPR